MALQDSFLLRTESIHAKDQRQAVRWVRVPQYFPLRSKEKKKYAGVFGHAWDTLKDDRITLSAFVPSATHYSITGADGTEIHRHKSLHDAQELLPSHIPCPSIGPSRQRMQGGKLKAARMVVSSPNLKNALHKQSHPTDSSSTARTSRAASNAPSRCLGETLKGGGDGEEDVGCAADIKVHNRVADEVLGLSPGEKKSWWVPHPETGVFTPQPESKALSSCGPRLPCATVDEDKRVWIRAGEDLENADP